MVLVLVSTKVANHGVGYVAEISFSLLHEFNNEKKMFKITLAFPVCQSWTEVLYQSVFCATIKCTK